MHAVSESDNPTALISYSHDSPEHERAVLELCNRLRAHGIDAFVDQFLPGAPSEGWPLWMERQIEQRDFTLMVCTEAYRRRFMEDEVEGIGRGVVWEARILRNLLYENKERHGRIVPVLLQSEAQAFVPTVFRGHFYDLSDERGFESLLRHMLREPGAEAGALGALGPEGSRWSVFEQPWLVPDAMRTRYFTGREDLLASLHSQLAERHRAALSGLGGVGKTQVAIEYAVRHRAEYPDGVFWVNAETIGGLTSGFVEIAKTLRLPAATSSDQERIVRAVLEWLNETDRWLLILDNVDDRRDLRPFVPPYDKGDIIITSRESVFQELGISRRLEVVDLDNDEALRFLLARTGRQEVDAQERAAATELAAELGNLPLALEQAAAYVTETNAAFSAYLSAFRKRRIALLEKAGGLVSRDTVAVTWAANFEAVEHASPAAADVLRLSAFLAADGIPFELFLNGAQLLGEPIAEALADPDDLAMAEVLRPLTRYSLIRSDATSRVFGVHRLVQEIVTAAIPEPERRTYVERAVRALNASIPEVNYANWTQYESLVTHVTSIAGDINFEFAPPEVSSRVLNRTGEYLRRRGRYAEALPLHERALAILERALGPNHSDVATALSGLAALHHVKGRYAEAQPLYERALASLEDAQGPNHPDVARVLNGLASLYRNQGRYAEARTLHERALAIREKALGPDHPDVAMSLNNLAILHDDQGRFAAAQPLYERALAIWENALGPDHPEVARVRNNLAEVLRHQGRYAEAEPLYERALATREKALGPDHPDVAASIFGLAVLLWKLGRYAEAQPLHERALTIRERALGPDHTDVAKSRNNLALIYHAQGRYAEAQPLFERAQAIFENTLGPDHPDVAACLHNQAMLHYVQGRHADAQPLYERAQAIFEKALGPEHPGVAMILNNLAVLHLDHGRYAEAQPLHERALAIREKALGPDHPDVAMSLDSLAELAFAQGRYDETQALYERARVIWEKAFGPDYPEAATSLIGLAHVYVKQQRFPEAERLYGRALVMLERGLAADHPLVAKTLVGLASLHKEQDHAVQALAFYDRALAIKERTFAADHPELEEIRSTIEALRKATGSQ